MYRRTWKCVMYSIFEACVYMWVYGTYLYVGVYILDVEMYKHIQVYIHCKCIYVCITNTGIGY